MSERPGHRRKARSPSDGTNDLQASFSRTTLGSRHPRRVPSASPPTGPPWGYSGRHRSSQDDPRGTQWSAGGDREHTQPAPRRRRRDMSSANSEFDEDLPAGRSPRRTRKVPQPDHQGATEPRGTRRHYPGNVGDVPEGEYFQDSGLSDRDRESHESGDDTARDAAHDREVQTRLARGMPLGSLHKAELDPTAQESDSDSAARSAAAKVETERRLSMGLPVGSLHKVGREYPRYPTEREPHR